MACLEAWKWGKESDPYLDWFDVWVGSFPPFLYFIMHHMWHTWYKITIQRTMWGGENCCRRYSSMCSQWHCWQGRRVFWASFGRENPLSNNHYHYIQPPKSMVTLSRTKKGHHFILPDERYPWEFLYSLGTFIVLQQYSYATNLKKKKQ